MKTAIEMAREVGAGEPESLYGRTDYVVMTKFEIERFAELIRADEREACAKVCDDLQQQWRPSGEGADAIRARNPK